MGKTIRSSDTSFSLSGFMMLLLLLRLRLRRMLASLLRPFLDGQQHAFALYGLADVIIHACLKALVAITFHCIGGHCDDGRVLIWPRKLPDLLSRL